MIKKTINYTDYEGNPQSEVCYFNLTKAEVIEMELDPNGSLENLVNEIMENKEPRRIAELIKKFILRSYCEKTSDGKRIIKTPEITAAFAASEAYSELFMSLTNDADELANFFNGVLPFVPEDAKKEAEQKILEGTVTALPKV